MILDHSGVFPIFYVSDLAAILVAFKISPVLTLGGEGEGGEGKGRGGPCGPNRSH